MGVRLELVPVTGAARIPSLLSDKIDILIAGLGATPERAQQVMFSQPYAVVNLGVYGAKAIPAATGKKPDNLTLRPSVFLPVAGVLWRHDAKKFTTA